MTHEQMSQMRIRTELLKKLKAEARKERRTIQATLELIVEAYFEPEIDIKEGENEL